MKGVVLLLRYKDILAIARAYDAAKGRWRVLARSDYEDTAVFSEAGIFWFLRCKATGEVIAVLTPAGFVVETSGPATFEAERIGNINARGLARAVRTWAFDQETPARALIWTRTTARGAAIESKSEQYLAELMEAQGIAPKAFRVYHLADGVAYIPGNGEVIQALRDMDLSSVSEKSGLKFSDNKKSPRDELRAEQAVAYVYEE